MEIADVKEYIYDNNRVEQILEELGCHHIVKYDNPSGQYFTCGNFDGDNKNAITVYLSPSLNVKNYTRDITDKYGCSDLISLVCYNKKMFFTEAIKWLCDLVGLDFYNDNPNDIPLSLQQLILWDKMKSNIDEEEDIPLRPISEDILKYYINCANDVFQRDSISLNTQNEFEIGYDLGSNRITIPIRDELGNLIGVKGRLYKQDTDEYNPKYLYLEPCAKSHILYGLYKTLPYILQAGTCYVFESEKAVMQMWSYGYKNVVSVGGHDLSKKQVEKLTRLNVDIVFCYDADVGEGQIAKERSKFVKGVNLYYLLDKDKNILNEKESPSDNKEKFEKLLSEHKYVVGQWV